MPYVRAIEIGRSFHVETVESVLQRGEELLASIERLPQSEWLRLSGLAGADLCDLAPQCSTDEQAVALAASIWGLHRVNPTQGDPYTRLLLQLVGEFFAAPLGASDGGALLVLSLVARRRWRSRGQVRDPRSPRELLCLPKAHKCLSE